jgi:hypothetical protein
LNLLLFSAFVTFNNNSAIIEVFQFSFIAFLIPFAAIIQVTFFIMASLDSSAFTAAFTDA